jgi:hypothetical protein
MVQCLVNEAQGQIFFLLIPHSVSCLLRECFKTFRIHMNVVLDVIPRIEFSVAALWETTFFRHHMYEMSLL